MSINDTLGHGYEEFLVTHPWIHHYEQGVPASFEIPNHPLTWLLDTTASRYPGNTAFLYFGNRISYAQFSSLTNRFAVGLLKLGVQKGDRVAISLPNIPQYPIAFYGTLRAGAIVVPTNPLYTKHELLHQLKDSGARFFVMLDSFYPLVREIREEVGLEKVIVTSPADFLPFPLRTLYPLSQRGVKNPEPALTAKEIQSDPSLLTMHDLLDLRANKGGVELYHLPGPASGDDLAVLQYTGGTTGYSKGAMLTHRNLLANAMQTRYWNGGVKDGHEITLCVAPFFHSYGMTVGMNLSIFAAATMILVPRFKAKEVLDTIRRYHPTIFPGIPTMYIAILREAGEKTAQLRSIKYCISGAAALPAKVQSDFEEVTGGKLVEGYGLSEASPVTHCNPLTEECRNGSIGLPLPNVDAMILDSTSGEPTPIGEIGEIMVKGPNIMQGYWNSKDNNLGVFYNGWLHTGDVGRMDADGFFYVVERKKDLIIASGFNIYPREVEEVLFRHPAIVEAAAVGVPDEYRGETVAAFVVLKPDHAPSEETKQDIIAFCKQELAPYKVPKILEFRESLPKSLVGKVLRRELRVTK